MATFIALAAVLITSSLSGILGMGGGFILAGILVFIMPLTSALLLHASSQFVANGFRAWLQRRSIVWHVVGWYVIGLSGTVLVFSVVRLQLDKNLFYVLLGLVAVSSHFIPASFNLNITHKTHAILAGFLVSALHLFIGVAGPLLDVFFQRAQLTRFQIVATKAATQVIGHAMRLGFYLAVWRQHWTQADLNLWLLAGVFCLAMTGTLLGTKLLAMISDRQFGTFTRALLNILGVLFIAKGLYGFYG